MIGSTCELEHQMDLAQSYTVSISFMAGVPVKSGAKRFLPG